MGLIANESVEKEAEALGKAIEQAIEAVSGSLRPLAPQLDGNPGGDVHIALVAVLRSFAELLEEDLPEGGKKAITELQGLITKGLKEHGR